MKKTLNDLKQEVDAHLLLREGKRNKVYKDSLGKETVGVGHLVRPEDNLKLGDVISDERVAELLKADSAEAFNAALAQVKMLSMLDKYPEAQEIMIVALASVNFQLGVAWRSKFKNTWALIQLGKLSDAQEALKDSLWYAQTPVRVKDFCAALDRVEDIISIRKWTK